MSLVYCPPLEWLILPPPIVCEFSATVTNTRDKSALKGEGFILTQNVRNCNPWPCCFGSAVAHFLVMRTCDCLLTCGSQETRDKRVGGERDGKERRQVGRDRRNQSPTFPHGPLFLKGLHLHPPPQKHQPAEGQIFNIGFRRAFRVQTVTGQRHGV